MRSLHLLGVELPSAVFCVLSGTTNKRRIYSNIFSVNYNKKSASAVLYKLQHFDCF
jgi:hypothetical protein